MKKKHGEESKFKRKHIYNKILSWDTTNFILKDTSQVNLSPDFSYIYKAYNGVDTIFKNEDREYHLKQFAAIKDTIWHHGFLKSKLLTKKTQKRSSRYYYSIPLFSADKKYVIVFRQFYCGNLCAYGGYYIYRKLEDKWEYLISVNTWMS